MKFRQSTNPDIFTQIYVSRDSSYEYIRLLDPVANQEVDTPERV